MIKIFKKFIIPPQDDHTPPWLNWNIAKEYETKKSRDKYSILESTLRDWLKNKEKFENLDSIKLSLTTLHKGRPVKYPEVNNKMIDYIEFNRKSGLPITTCALLIKLY